MVFDDPRIAFDFMEGGYCSPLEWPVPQSLWVVLRVQGDRVQLVPASWTPIDPEEHCSPQRVILQEGMFLYVLPTWIAHRWAPEIVLCGESHGQVMPHGLRRLIGSWPYGCVPRGHREETPQECWEGHRYVKGWLWDLAPTTPEDAAILGRPEMVAQDGWKTLTLGRLLDELPDYDPILRGCPEGLSPQQRDAWVEKEDARVRREITEWLQSKIAQHGRDAIAISSLYY
jgi:hypothetical protein